LADQASSPTFEQIHAISPLKKTRLKVCLSLLINNRVVASERGHRYRLLRPGMSSEQIGRLSQSYRDRHERELLAQQQMVEYAERFLCRWQAILSHFDSDELSGGRCGHCDVCESLGTSTEAPDEDPD
jgi:hypothetical protein